MEKPNYYGILPADVRYDKNLKPMEKILYTEFTALSNKNGYCNASNNYFAELFDTSKETVSRWISNLEKQGYIKTEIVYKDKTRIIEERRIYIIPIDKKINTYCEKSQDPIDKKINTPIDENVKDNNTRYKYYKKNNNKKNIKKSSDDFFSKTPKEPKQNLKEPEEEKPKEEPKETKNQKRAREIKEFIENLNKANDYKELLFKFVEYRKNINKPYKTIIPIKKLIKQFPDYFSLEEATNLAIEKEWQSVEPEWVANYKNSKKLNYGKNKEPADKNNLLVDENFIEQMKERYK